MTFGKIDYLEWARTHLGRVKYDLAKSNIRSVTKEELNLSLDQIDLAFGEEGGEVELRDLIARRYGVPRTGVLVTAGATMGLFIACSAVLKAGDQALLESPIYEPIHRAAEHTGAELKTLERRFERGYQLDIEEVERKVGRGTRAILLTNAHNPSGAVTSPEKMMTLGQIARDYGATVISDEVYLDNAFAPGLKPAASFGPNMVSIGSLSKVYGLGGLRIGWIVAAEPILRKARQILDYLECELPAPSEKIAILALRRAPELILRCQQIAMRNVKIVSEWVARRGDIQWVEPQGGTVCMVRLPAGVEAQPLASLLQEKYSTLVVPGEFFWVRGYLRLSTGTDEEILRQGLKNVSKAIDQLKARRS